MSDVGDAIELTYTTTPGATVTMDWIHTNTGAVIQQDVAVSELVVDTVHTGQYPITLVGALAGVYEAVFTATGTATATDSYFERFDPITSTPPLATLGEYTSLYGSLSTARAATARALLNRASRLVRDSYPGIDQRIADGVVPGDSVGLAVLNMVARVMRNPGGLRSETTGPFSRAYDPDSASGMLVITTADTDLLTPPTGGKGARNRMGSTRVTGGLVPASTQGCGRDIMFGPWGA